MNFNINNVFRSTINSFSLAIITCCLITSNVSLVVNHDYTNGALVVLSIAGIVLLGLIIWFFWSYIKDRKVERMPGKPGKVFNVIDDILFVVWILTTVFTKICHPITVILSWCLLAFAIIYYVVYSYNHRADRSHNNV